MPWDVCDMRQFYVVGRFWTQQHRRCKIYIALAIITDHRLDDASFPPKPAKEFTNKNCFFPTPIR
jgi:hypothetical protein